MKQRKKLIIAFLLCLGIWGCKKANEIEILEFIGFHKPTYFPEPTYNFAVTPLSQETFELGRKLFYDGILSRDNTISCASCHISHNAFTHHGHDVSHGIDDKLGTRNSPSLVNLAWSNAFFWDGGVQQLDLASIVPIHNPIEMDESLDNVVQKIKLRNDYPKLFEKAFGTKDIEPNHILKALSHFLVMLISDNSKYDLVKRNEAKFTIEEERGYKIFESKCNSCHREPLFTDQSFRDNGLGINQFQDLGRFEITGNDNDKLKFKVPTLRNLKYTAPYMHDGSFYTIEAVLRHYSHEVVLTENIDPILKINKGIPISETDKKDLIAFLNTLNDESFIKNKSFMQP